MGSPTASASSIPAVLIDTCVISGLARGDMKPEDAAGFCHMAEMVRRSELTIWASTVAREELDKIPPQFRDAHIREYDALRIVRASNVTWVDTDPASSAFGAVVQHPVYQTLRRLLPDTNDARLVFQAKMAGVCDYVTVDYRTVLSRAADVHARVGVRLLSPSQYVSQRST